MMKLYSSRGLYSTILILLVKLNIFFKCRLLQARNTCFAEQGPGKVAVLSVSLAVVGCVRA